MPRAITTRCGTTMSVEQMTHNKKSLVLAQSWHCKMNSGDINCVSSVLKARWGWGTGPLLWLHAVHNWFCCAFILGSISMAGLWRRQTWQTVINMQDSLFVMNEWLSKVINFFGLLRKTGWYSSSSEKSRKLWLVYSLLLHGICGQKQPRLNQI